MTGQTITCPSCHAPFKLDESLAAPLIAATRQEFEQKLAAKDAHIAQRETALQAQQQDLAEKQAALDEQVAAKVGAEREKIAAEEAKKARLLMDDQLSQNAKQLADLQEVLDNKNEKLAEAQNAQADLLKKQRELEDEKRELAVTVEKRVKDTVDTTVAATRQEYEEKLAAKDTQIAQREATLQEQQQDLAHKQAALEQQVATKVAAEREKIATEEAKQDAESSLKLKVTEKEEQIASMQRQIEELKRKAEQGSQQLQGEAQEIELEGLLRARFPQDNIEPVAKGEFGGDVIQRVVGPYGQLAGTILWESKRTKNWSEAWLAKLREDQRAAKADTAVIISTALPKGLTTFDLSKGFGWST